MSAEPETCATCLWWHRQGSALARLSLRLDVDPDVGTCQASPPVAIHGWPGGVFPQVHANRTCGAWVEADEEPDGPDGGDVVDDKVVPLRAAA